MAPACTPCDCAYYSQKSGRNLPARARVRPRTPAEYRTCYPPLRQRTLSDATYALIIRKKSSLILPEIVQYSIRPHRERSRPGLLERNRSSALPTDAAAHPATGVAGGEERNTILLYLLRKNGLTQRWPDTAVQPCESCIASIGQVVRGSPGCSKKGEGRRQCPLAFLRTWSHDMCHSVARSTVAHAGAGIDSLAGVKRCVWRAGNAGFKSRTGRFPMSGIRGPASDRWQRILGESDRRICHGFFEVVGEASEAA